MFENATLSRVGEAVRKRRGLMKYWFLVRLDLYIISRNPIFPLGHFLSRR